MLAYNGTVYVANNGSSNISVIDEATGTVTGTIPVSGDPFLMTAADGFLYTSNPSHNTVSVVDLAPAAPNPPMNLTAAPGARAVTLSWTKPANADGTTTAGYRVYAATTPGGEDDTGPAACTTSSGGDTSCTVTGLSAGTPYSFTVEAFNRAGASTMSNEASATPTSPPVVVSAPSAPQAVQVTGGQRQLEVAWTAPTSDGGSAVTGYRAYVATSPGGEDVTGTPGCATSDPATMSCRITGLADDTTYYVVVEAENAIGSSPPSAEASATTSAPAAVAPTLRLGGGHVVLPRGAHHRFRGVAPRGALVTLHEGALVLSHTRAVDGTFSLRHRFTSSGRYYVTAAGLRSSSIAVRVVRLTVHLRRHRDLAPGRHRLFGHAPAGLTVTLLRDGHAVATATANDRNRYHFTRRFTGTHRYRTRVDHVRSPKLRVHVQDSSTSP